jgi:exosome complex RNA-binding protein Csl4
MLTSIKLADLLRIYICMSTDVSVSGAAMVPVSWTEMQCPKTYVKEPRKVAKVVPETGIVD